MEQLLGRIPNTEGRKVTLKYKKKDIVDDRRPLADIFDEVMNSETSEQTTKTVNLFLERVERRGGLSRDWVLYVKTLTGRTFDIRFSNPQVRESRDCIHTIMHHSPFLCLSYLHLPLSFQEVSIIGLKLLIEEECGVKPEQMRLVLDSQQLEESTRLVENIPGISNECTIHLVMKGS